jgi:hypothetical protein
MMRTTNETRAFFVVVAMMFLFGVGITHLVKNSERYGLTTLLVSVLILVLSILFVLLSRQLIKWLDKFWP